MLFIISFRWQMELKANAKVKDYSSKRLVCLRVRWHLSSHSSSHFSINSLSKSYWHLNWFLSDRLLTGDVWISSANKIPQNEKLNVMGEKIFLRFRVVWVICYDKECDGKDWMRFFQLFVLSAGSGDEELESRGDSLSSFDFSSDWKNETWVWEWNKFHDDGRKLNFSFLIELVTLSVKCAQ